MLVNIQSEPSKLAMQNDLNGVMNQFVKIIVSKYRKTLHSRNEKNSTFHDKKYRKTAKVRKIVETLSEKETLFSGNLGGTTNSF